MRGARAVCVAVVVGLYSLVAPASASAGDQCNEAYESGQRLRKKGSLRAASHELVVCAREGCPSQLASDCLRWLGEVEAALPSIVIAVVDAREGRDVIDARVAIDGADPIDPSDGHAIDLDPGRHRIRVTAPKRAAVEEEVIVREGEKRRAVRITIAATGVMKEEHREREREQPKQTTENSHTLAWVLFGIGGVSLAGAGGFGLYGLSQKSDLDGCRPGCDRAQVDAANRTFLLSDILLAVGLVAAGAGTFFYFYAPSPSSNQAAR